MSRLTKMALSAAGTLGAVTLMISSAVADFTPVLQSGEADHEDILECIYGDGFSRVGETDFENVELGITVVRIDDFVNGDPEALGENLNIGAPSPLATDQVWEDGVVHAVARARFAALSQSFGYFEGESGGEFLGLFDVSGGDCDVSGETGVSFDPDETWRWADLPWTSRTSDNVRPPVSHPSSSHDAQLRSASLAPGEDHMVTYQVLGVHGGAVTFLLFWEDLEGLGDQDYNDLVVELVVLTADLDIKPGSCPNPLNRGANGVLPVALVGTDTFDVTEVDLSSVALFRADGVGGSVTPNEGSPGPHSTFEDVATPFDGGACDCHDMGADGIVDLSMKFRMTDVLARLELGDLMGGQLVELVLGGELFDGTPFEVRDCIWLVPPRN